MLSYTTHRGEWLVSEHNQVDKSVLRRIQKLLAKADSLKQLGNEAEAMAFLDGANKLLMKHKLEMSDIDLKLRDQEDPVKMHYVNPGDLGLKSKKAQILWENALVKATAEAYFCRIIVVEKSNHFWLVGRREDRAIAEFMIVTLIRFAEQEADRAYVKYFYECKDKGDVTLARGYRSNFLLGFTDRVVGRFKDEFKQAEKEGGQHAIVRIQQERKATQDFMDQLRQKGFTKDLARPNLRGQVNHAGLEAGKAAGARANLRARAVEGSAESKPRLLTDGG